LRVFCVIGGGAAGGKGFDLRKARAASEAAFWVLARRTATGMPKVLNSRLMAVGNLRSNIFSTKACVPWSGATLLGWTEEGLYVVRNGFWGRATCVLPGLNKTQAMAVRTAISKRFPDIAFKVLPSSTVQNFATSQLEYPGIE
jgi:hypothetical protein